MLSPAPKEAHLPPNLSPQHPPQAGFFYIVFGVLFFNLGYK